MTSPGSHRNRYMCSCELFAALFCLVLSRSTVAEVIAYAAPAGETLSAEYEVWVDGKRVDVYTARTLDEPFAGKEWDYGGAYAFASFDMTGEVAVKIVAKRSLHEVAILPASAGVVPNVDGDQALSFHLSRPVKLSIEPDGRKSPLLLFANPPETNVPKPDAKDVVYFGPGVHKPGKIELRDGQTLYLAGGAVVKGGVIARGDHITIRGRGILDGSDWKWCEGPTEATIDMHGTNIEVEGITIRGAPQWTIVPQHSRNVTIRNVKLCNARVQNDDGINPCNSQDVLITDCFIRTDDDCVAMKGLTFGSANDNVERIVVENCVLWCDRARIFLLGHECRAPFMRDITLRNLDIIHFAMTPFLLEPGEEMRIEHVSVEDVRIHGEGQQEFLRLRPVVNQYMQKKTPGFVSDIRFENVHITGKPGAYLVQLSGADTTHIVKSVDFKNVTILRDLLTKTSKNVQTGENVDGVTFAPGR